MQVENNYDDTLQAMMATNSHTVGQQKPVQNSLFLGNPAPRVPWASPGVAHGPAQGVALGRPMGRPWGGPWGGP